MCVGYSPGIFYTGSVYTAARPAHPHWPCHVSVMSDCSLGTCRAPICAPAISRIVARRIHITHTSNRIPVIHTHALTPTRHSGTKETRGAEV